MRNRLPTYPGRVHLAPVEGQANVFDLTRADQPQDPGTPLNKGTLLSDDVEALIWGAAADRTPNDAFGKISELFQHWWSVLHGQAYSYWDDVKTPLTTRTEIYFGAGEKAYSKEIAFDVSGNISLVNPTQFPYSYNTLAEIETILKEITAAAPCYLSWRLEVVGTKIIYIPAGANYTISSISTTAPYTFTAGKDNDNDERVFLNIAPAVPSALVASSVSSQLVTVPAGETTYVHSPDRSAYPDSGTVDGLTYKYLGVPFNNARQGGKIEAGTYSGTGTTSKKSLTFGFKPEIVFIWAAPLSYSDGGMQAIFVQGATGTLGEKGNWGSTISDNEGNTVYLTAEWSGNTLSWQHGAGTKNAISMLNKSGKTYYYKAIG